MLGDDIVQRYRDLQVEDVRCTYIDSLTIPILTQRNYFLDKGKVVPSVLRKHMPGDGIGNHRRIKNNESKAKLQQDTNKKGPSHKFNSPPP